MVEAKPDNWGVRLTSVEEQSEGYANAKLKWVTNPEPLPFLYESTGQVTRFTNAHDPNARSREVFTFHRPETLKSWAQAPMSLRAGIASLPALNPDGLRDCQIKAITNLESSLKADKPRALVQMANRVGQDLHGDHAGLPTAQTRRRAPHHVPGRHQEPWRAGRTGIHGLHPKR
ncbi:hypothetical protein [Citreimonas sp.]|uniref:hypothetical protein n=1 Tax=Citreimonas sp. TaxID=3036715 RepID=UPI0035C80D59